MNNLERRGRVSLRADEYPPQMLDFLQRIGDLKRLFIIESRLEAFSESSVQEALFRELFFMMKALDIEHGTVNGEDEIFQDETALAKITESYNESLNNWDDSAPKVSWGSGKPLAWWLEKEEESFAKDYSNRRIKESLRKFFRTAFESYERPGTSENFMRKIQAEIRKVLKKKSKEKEEIDLFNAMNRELFERVLGLLEETQEEVSLD